jgi:hypothetical protein
VRITYVGNAHFAEKRIFVMATRAVIRGSMLTCSDNFLAMFFATSGCL